MRYREDNVRRAPLCTLRHAKKGGYSPPLPICSAPRESDGADVVETNSPVIVF